MGISLTCKRVLSSAPLYTIGTRPVVYIQEDDILYIHRRVYLKSYLPILLYLLVFGDPFG
jgi:hypothetical protein